MVQGWKCHVSLAHKFEKLELSYLFKLEVLVKKILLIILLLNLRTLLAYSAEPTPQDMDLPPKVGRDAAAKYFEKRNGAQDVSDKIQHKVLSGGALHYLSLGVSHYAASQSYLWGRQGQQEGIAKDGIDMTYRAGEMYRFMDLSLRISYNEFSLGGEDGSKLSFMPLLSFPEASAKFPLYFGIGAGVGVFLTQVNGKSPLSLDYQLVIGSRFLDIFENTGFFVEAGLKNHLLLTSSGQMNGTFMAGGLVFTF